jgi:hypothetical protein
MDNTSNIVHSKAEHQCNLHLPKNWLVKSSHRAHMETLLPSMDQPEPSPPWSYFKRRISPAAIALSIDFEPFMISNTNALSWFATSGFTHPWMSICLVNQIQSNLKTGLRQTKIGFLAMSHTATPPPLRTAAHHGLLLLNHVDDPPMPTSSRQYWSHWTFLLVFKFCNAPLTCESGGSAGNETSARCSVKGTLLFSSVCYQFTNVITQIFTTRSE